MYFIISKQRKSWQLRVVEKDASDGVVSGVDFRRGQHFCQKTDDTVPVTADPTP